MSEDREFNGPPGFDRRGPRSGPGGRGRFQRRRICAFCVDKVEKVDYKEVGMLRRFISDQGQIDSRRRTGTCRASSAPPDVGDQAGPLSGASAVHGRARPPLRIIDTGG